MLIGFAARSYAVVAVWLFRQIIVDPQMSRDMFEFEPTWFQVTSFNWQVNPLVLGLILFSWMPYTRVLYTQVSLLKEAEKSFLDLGEEYYKRNYAAQCYDMLQTIEYEDLFPQEESNEGSQES